MTVLACAAVAALLQLSPGKVVGGDFRIIEPLSAGGMGALYVTEQLSTGKQRALKVMHDKLVRDSKLRERFVQEARVGALIESDHVVEVIAAGVDEPTGMPWIAMELLAGQDLADFVAAGGSLPPAELVHLLRQLCHALGAAHEAGVVHRDVKPENVFLAEAHSASVPWVVKVLDFGIAKVAAQAQATATAPIGSPAWMAPEQTDAQPVITPATDVWAVGLMAFWLLTGRSYWRSINDTNASVIALLREVLFEPLATATSRAEALGVLDRLPTGFDGWFSRCVVRDRAARYVDAHTAFDALEQLLVAAGLDVSPPAPSTRPSFDRISAPPENSARDPRSAWLAPAPTAPMAPAHLSATASPLVTDAGQPSGLGELPASRRGLRAAAAGVALALGGLLALTLGADRPDSVAPLLAGAARASAGVAQRVGGLSARLHAAAVAAPPRRPVDSAAASLQLPASVPRAAPTPDSSRPRAPGRPTTSAREGSSSPFATPPPDDGATGSGATNDTTAPGPFDPAAAQLSTQRQAAVASHHCRHLPGPRIIQASVVFAPSGAVERVALAHRSQRPGSTTECVRNVLSHARVAPYRGGPERVGVVVPLQ